MTDVYYQSDTQMFIEDGGTCPVGWTPYRTRDRSKPTGYTIDCEKGGPNPVQPTPITTAELLPVARQPDTQPIIPISTSSAPAAGVVLSAGGGIDYKIIISIILVIILGFLLSRR